MIRLFATRTRLAGLSAAVLTACLSMAGNALGLIADDGTLPEAPGSPALPEELVFLPEGAGLSEREIILGELRTSLLHAVERKSIQRAPAPTASTDQIPSPLVERPAIQHSDDALAIPEPSTILLLGIGISLGLAGLAWRSSKR